MAGDPVTERLRDALGAVRCLYAAAPDAEAKAALKRAGEMLGTALAIAENRGRTKELEQKVRAAQIELAAAAQAVPWGSPVLLGAASLLRSVTGASAPPPPPEPTKLTPSSAPPPLGLPPFHEGVAAEDATSGELRR